MSFPLIYIQSPGSKDYEKFFNEVLERLSNDVSGIDVLVGDTIESTGELNEVLLHLYPQLRRIAAEKGLTYRFDIDVLINVPVSSKGGKAFCPEDEKVGMDNVEYIPAPVAARQSKCDYDWGLAYKEVETSAVGGTFDHIHDGHKILLLMTAFAAKRKIIVGVTGPKLLVKKKFAEFMEPLSTRVLKVCKFLQKVASPGVSFHIYQINDICGPTGFLRAIDALIISQETVKGGEFVNNYRKERDYPAIEIVVVKVIGGDGSGDEANNWKGKLSSTDIREEEYKTLH